MSNLSFTPKNLTSSDTSLSVEQIQGSIQPFQNWTDGLKIQTNLENRPMRRHARIVKKNTSFTNGPYVEIKESIGKFFLPQAA